MKIEIDDLRNIFKEKKKKEGKYETAGPITTAKQTYPSSSR